MMVVSIHDADSRSSSQDVATDNQEGDSSCEALEEAKEERAHLLEAIGTGQADVRTIAEVDAQEGDGTRISIMSQGLYTM